MAKSPLEKIQNNLSKVGLRLPCFSVTNPSYEQFLKELTVSQKSLLDPNSTDRNNIEVKLRVIERATQDIQALQKIQNSTIQNSTYNIDYNIDSKSSEEVSSLGLTNTNTESSDDF